MKFNKWTVGLAAVGVVSLASAARADEQMSQVQTALSSTTLSGYVDTAATWRPGTDLKQIDGDATIHLPAYSFAKNDGFSVNAVDLALDKPMDESPWAAGYHIELMAGPDAVPNLDGLAAGAEIRQAYLALRTPVGSSGIDWKVGVWDTIIGYESTSDPLNPNYTRSYGYTIEPTTHTGVLATYKINDIVSVSGGIADDSNAGRGTVFVNGNHAESQKAYMGSVAFTAPDSMGWLKGATLTFGGIDTAGLAAAPGSTSLYAGMTLPTPVTALKLGWAFDAIELHDRTVANHSDDTTWVAGLYASYQFNDQLSFNTRAEYLTSGGASLYDGTVDVPVNGGSNAAEELTATVQYNLWANVISRAEFRWDHAEHGNFYGVNQVTGFADRGNDFLLALNLIYQF